MNNFIILNMIIIVLYSNHKGIDPQATVMTLHNKLKKAYFLMNVK